MNLATQLAVFLSCCLRIPYNDSYLSLYFSVRSRVITCLLGIRPRAGSHHTYFRCVSKLEESQSASTRNVRLHLHDGVDERLLDLGHHVQVDCYTEDAPSLDWSDAGFGRGRYGIPFIYLSLSPIRPCKILDDCSTTHSSCLSGYISADKVPRALYIFCSINSSLEYDYGFWLLSLMLRDAKEII